MRTTEGRWAFWSKPRLSAVGLALIGLSLPLLPLGDRLSAVLASTVVHGAGYAAKDIVGHSLLADLVDERGVGSYAMAYSLADVADSAGYVAGPLVGFALCRAVGSRKVGLAISGIACAALAWPTLSIRVSEAQAL